MNGIPRKKRAYLVRPLHNDQAVLLEQLGEADCLEILGAADAIGVKVKELEPPGVVDVEQDESGAGDGALIAPKALEQAAHEVGFARAHLTVQRDALAAGEPAGKLGRERFG